MLKYRQDKDGTVTFQVNCELYPLTAIYRAAYLFTDRYYIGLDRKGYPKVDRNQGLIQRIHPGNGKRGKSQ